MIIRPEAEGDGAAIGEAVAAAFRSSVEARLVEGIRASPHFLPELSLVADIEGEVVGHVMISSVELVDGEVRRRIVSLSPLAVAPAHQGTGVGSALVRAVTGRAGESGEPLVVLEGNPKYYGRFGFEWAEPLGIRTTLPSWAPPEAAQVLRLAGYDPSLRGQVVYPPAFAEALRSSAPPAG